MTQKNLIIALSAIVMILLNPTIVTVKISTTLTQNTYIVEDESSIAIGNDYIELVFDKIYGGGLESIIDKETGIDLRPDNKSVPTTFLFWINNGTATEGVLNWQAKNTQYQSITESDHSTLTILNSNLKGYDIHATTTITVHTNDQFVEMRLSVENNEPYIIESTLFPVIWGLGKIGLDSSDDTLFYPAGDGLLLHDPLSDINNLNITGGKYPGTLSLQLLCHYDKNETGLYFASSDTAGNPKTINYGNMEWDGLDHLSTSFEYYIPEVEGNDFTMDYDIIVGSFHGDWHQAASRYKKWAETTPFVSGGKINETKDIPVWFDDTSIIQLVNRDNPTVEVFSLADIVDITNEYAILSELDTTVLIIGWEQNGAWVGPYYYPPVEGEIAFQTAMNSLTQEGNHGFTYISGTVWRITRDDIGYADYELFNSTGLPWVALQRDHTPLFDVGYEAIGWHSARMCPMTDFWHDMIVFNALENVRLGCDVVQIDEFPIGAIYPCYNASHNHSVGYSNEITQAYCSILEDIRNQGRSLNADFIMSAEEPCEVYLPYLDTYVSRDAAPEGLLYLDIVNTYADQVEFIPFFSFVYHEYITSFGEGIGLDEGYATSFYHQMARAIGKMFVTGEIIKVGGTSTQSLDMDLFELFTRTATATTTYAKEYLINGEPLTPPEINVPIIEINWYNAIQDELGTPLHEPAVFNSAWRKDDGTKGFVFVNWYPSSFDFEVEINDELLHDGYYGVAMTINGDQTIIQSNITLPTTVSLSIQQNDIVLLEIIDSVDTNPPNNPNIIGPTKGKINTAQTYTISTTDPDQDMVSFYVDWGDETSSGWTDFVSSNTTMDLSHTWDHEDTFAVRVKAKDSHGLESEWETLEVTMPKWRITDYPIIQFLLELFGIFTSMKVLQFHVK